MRLLATVCVLLTAAGVARGEDVDERGNLQDEEPMQTHQVQRIELSVADPAGLARHAWPVSSGVPLPRGRFWDAAQCRLEDAAGAPVPVQVRATSRWEDGSVQWLLLNFVASTRASTAPTATQPDSLDLEAPVLPQRPERNRPSRSAGGQASQPGQERSEADRRAMAAQREEYRRRWREQFEKIPVGWSDPGPATRYVLVLNDGTAAVPVSPVGISEMDGPITLSNGHVSFQIDRRTAGLLDGLTVDAKPMLRDADSSGLWLVDENGARFEAAAPDAVEVIEAGPVCAVVAISGPLASSAGQTLMRYRTRYELWADESAVRMSVSIIAYPTSAPAVAVRSASLHLGMDPARFKSAWIDAKPVTPAGHEPARLLQHRANRFGLTDASGATEGARSRGLASWSDGTGTVSLAVRDFWQHYPKGLAVGADGITVDLLPQLTPDLYNDITQPAQRVRDLYWFRKGDYLLRQGVRFTADMVVWFGDAPQPPPQLAQRVQQPLMAVAPPQVYCDSGVFGDVLPAKPGEFDQYESLFERGMANLERGRAWGNEYGWMNYGDTFGERRFNWVNNEYDLTFCALLQYARTGDLRWLWRADQQARHSADVDTIHRPLDGTFRGPMYSHSVGHVGGFIASGAMAGLDIEDSYASGAIDPGGHMFIQGLLLMGHLRGLEDYTDSAMQIAAFQAQDMSGDFSFRIERAAGWPIINMVSAYESTGDPYYLNAARLMVQTVMARQDPKDGGWLLPQNPTECDCGELHLGGKSFATAILLRGLVMYHHRTGDPAVAQSIVRACDWLMNCAFDPVVGGFRYKTNCPKYVRARGGPGIEGAMLAEGLLTATQLSGDPKYRQFVLGWLGQCIEDPPGDGKNLAMHVHQLAYAVDLLRRQGVYSLPAGAPDTQPAQPPAEQTKDR